MIQARGGSTAFPSPRICNADPRDDVNPGHAEVCDGVDNNCDRSTDEGVLITFHRDADADGYGDPAKRCRRAPRRRGM